MQGILRFIIDNFVTVAGAAILTVFTARIIFNIKIDAKSLFLYTASFVAVSGAIVAVANYGLAKLSPSLAMIFRTVFTTLTSILLLKFFFGLNIFKGTISEFVYNLFLAIGNFIAIFAFRCFGIELKEIKSSLIYTIIAFAIINMMVIIMLYLIKTFKLFSCFPPEIKAKAYKNYLIYILLQFVIITLNFYYYIEFGDSADGVTSMISVTMLIVFLTFSIFYTNTFFRLEASNQELEYQKFYNQALQSIINDLRRFKHNYNNILAVFGGYIKNKKWCQVERYYNEICSEIGKVSFLDNLTSLNIKSAGILGLIMAKYEYAKKMGVDFRVITEGEIDEVKMKISEFCEVLGILLDNAIEAAKDSVEKKVEVFMKREERALTFIVLNGINEKVDVTMIYEKGYSTKGEGRGLGLGIVNDIVSKYKNVILNTCADDSKFRQELIINL
ncbi:MAG TPA: GHKL domain-containing protein [Hungateiclostridium thermocellum]|uniref:Signal transduction histidine kinase regulating citrate/malate metabolism n=1 Tax=Acetivibrio thermocellus (strain ATCC 27405 / DSM 1237 / JCM 9322 / NBRC 103400 / NCIMB 10682 / NRRL B-4536 / VPI 7372) TaxID=203119 RepID=A3DF14_ACET2|nr:GHKL domain-containing protein [Acetivibrio thermocellus]ABN52543.1 signal transduction histidine kinase regulating citrate/malate metabolism [Acetivibrio thermocellus ATCC 27405]CDG35983.1 signal transduction histidine kinase regulating citrate/malate metabolism [Acetivibrio thermocellus BC1]HBW28165.1 GHKL domain-containing protein [Acetivibrio thermocellus]